MNNFELFKLKKAGLTNQHIRKILAYQERTGKSLSLKSIALVSNCPKPALFVERYTQLNSKACRREFNAFPSFSILDKVYPIELRQTYNPPVLLFYKGNIKLLHKPKLAIVGAREASKSGVHAVYKIIKELQNQFVIVSGLARGIDTAAHLASLKNGGKTIAVIGSGLDVVYPKENRKLQAYIAKHHLLLSEYAPQEKPLKHHFPERNRIIAGLSRGIIVAEAKMRSGSLITCEYALDEGRDIFAIPGNITDGKSAGCHFLIQEGAKCITSGLDVLSEYQL